MAKFEIPEGSTVVLELAELAIWPTRGQKDGLPRFKKEGRDQDRVSFTTGAMRVEPDRRHLTLPVIGTVRTHENTRRIERLIAKDRARVLAISVRRNGTRLDASVRVRVQRPQQPKVAHPGSRDGVDVGVRRLATVADEDGTMLEQVPNPRPLDAALKELRHASRARSRCTKGSRRYRERITEISRLHRRVNDVRTHHLHCLTTRLAKTHGRIVVEGLDAAGMLRQKADHLVALNHQYSAPGRRLHALQQCSDRLVGGGGGHLAQRYRGITHQGAGPLVRGYEAQLRQRNQSTDRPITCLHGIGRMPVPVRSGMKNAVAMFTVIGLFGVTRKTSPLTLLVPTELNLG